MKTKNNTGLQLTELAEKLKSTASAPEQTTISTAELNELKEKAIAEPPAKARRKANYSFTLSPNVIERLDEERAKQTFALSRSEYIEHLLKISLNL